MPSCRPSFSRARHDPPRSTSFAMRPCRSSCSWRRRRAARARHADVRAAAGLAVGRNAAAPAPATPAARASGCPSCRGRARPSPRRSFAWRCGLLADDRSAVPARRLRICRDRHALPQGQMELGVHRPRQRAEPRDIRRRRVPAGILPFAMNQFAIDRSGLTLALLSPLDTLRAPGRQGRGHRTHRRRHRRSWSCSSPSSLFPGGVSRRCG